MAASIKRSSSGPEHAPSPRVKLLESWTLKRGAVLSTRNRPKISNNDWCMTSSSALISGVAGSIGSHLAERCLDLGWRVLAVDAFTDYYPAPLKRSNVARAMGERDYELIAEDLLGLDLRSVLTEVDVVFHLAAQPGVRPSWDQFQLYTRQNIDATQRLLDAARGCALKRLVFASSSSVYGDAERIPTDEVALRPVSPYGVTKVACEHLAQAYWRNFEVPVVGLRYFTVYGPRQRPDMAFSRLITATLNGEPFRVFGDGDQTRDFTFVTDAVAATIAAAQVGTRGAVYNIGGGSRYSMNSVMDSLGALIGAPVEREYISRQSGDARDTAAEISSARRALGYEPATDLTRGLAAQLEWQRTAAAQMETRI
jgi:nucleoside-diphosphate-sugar epimerase